MASVTNMLGMLKRSLSPTEAIKEKAPEKKQKIENTEESNSIPMDQSNPDATSTTLNSDNCTSEGSQDSQDSESGSDSGSNSDSDSEDDVPKWGKTLLKYTKRLNRNMKALTLQYNNMSTKLTKIETDYVEVNSTTRKLNKKIQQLEVENHDLRDKHHDLKEKMLDLEYRQRRNNLVFDGIPEVANETDYDCFQKILYIIRGIPGINTDVVRVDRCHRLGASGGRSRSIIACFNWFGDVTSVLRNRTRLPRGVYVSEDFPVEWIDRRRVLRPLFMKLKEMDDHKNTTFLTKDKLIVKGKTYSAGPVSNLSELNTLFDLSTTCERRSNTTIAFHGIHSVFSNFHPAPYRSNNISFPTSEHGIQYGKADLFDDDIAKSRILKTNSPYQAKKIGGRIKHFDRKTWDNHSENIAFNAVLEKFSQNQILKNMLLTTADLDLVESSKELPWGTGIPLEHWTLDDARSYE